MKPERAKTLMPALVEAAGDVPIEMQCHNTVGVAGMNYLIGVEAGVRVLHTASGPMANGPSVPSTEQTVENLRWEGHTTKVDLDRVRRIGDHLRRVAEQEGHPIGVPNEYNVFPYHHQLPGGMTGTLKAQLAQYDMSDRFEEVLEEIVRVREDLGHPISATPFSQLMGIQAVLNVVTGERYGSVPDEVLVYVLGHLGEPPAPIDENVLDRMLSTDRGRGDAGMGAAATDDRRAQAAVRRSHDERRGALAALPRPAPGRRGHPCRRSGARGLTSFEDDGIPEALIDDLLAGSRIGFAEIETGGTTSRSGAEREHLRAPKRRTLLSASSRLTERSGACRTDARRSRGRHRDIRPMGRACVTTYEFDTTLDPDYPVLTRGNAGEIMPDIVSPLSATVFFPPLERGWRRSFTETWDVMDWPDCPTTFAPIVGGRFYINISAFRRLADLTPGTSPEDIDRTLFAAGGIKLDPYEPPDEDGYAERGERIAAATASFLENPPLDRVGGEHDAAQARRVEGARHAPDAARTRSCWHGSSRCSR